MEAFQQYTPMDPESPEAKAMATLAFINQVAPYIKRTLQRAERLGEKGLKGLVIMAEKVFNGREGTEKQIKAYKQIKERQVKEQRQQTPNMAKILLAATAKPEDHRRCLKQMASGRRKNQCAYHKEEGHWSRECSKKKKPIQTILLSKKP